MNKEEKLELELLETKRLLFLSQIESLQMQYGSAKQRREELLTEICTTRGRTREELLAANYVTGELKFKETVEPQAGPLRKLNLEEESK